MKLVQFSTPRFGAIVLEKISEKIKPYLLICAPDQICKRKKTLKICEAKKAALKLKIKIFQPSSLKDKKVIEFLKEIKPDLFLVASYGKILPKEVLEIPKFKTLGLHPSLLPKLRGPSPIQTAILNGEKKTGVTVFFLNEKVDTGDIIMQEPVDIKESDTAGDLHDRLAETGSRVLVKSIDLIKSGDFTPKPQKGAVTKAPKITQDLLKIRWDVSAEDVRNKVRAFSPFPGAFSFIEGKRVKIFSVDEEFIKSTKNAPGTVVSVDSSGITVQCADRCIFFREIQMQGKRRMTVSEFLRGNSINPGMIFLSG